MMKTLIISIGVLSVVVVFSTALPYSRRYNVGLLIKRFIQERQMYRRGLAGLGPVFSMSRFVPPMTSYGWFPGDGGQCNGAFTPPQWVPCGCPQQEDAEGKEEEGEGSAEGGEDKPKPSPAPAPAPSQPTPQALPQSAAVAPQPGGAPPQLPAAQPAQPQPAGASPQPGGASPQSDGRYTPKEGSSFQGGAGSQPVAAQIAPLPGTTGNGAVTGAGQQQKDVSTPAAASTAASYAPAQPPPIALPVTSFPGKGPQVSQMNAPVTASAQSPPPSKVA